MKTLKLSQPDTNVPGWDVGLDAAGNLAIETGAQAVAQDVASSVKVFVGDLFYDASAGIPYFDDVLGQGFSAPLVKALLEARALLVPTVVKAQAGPFKLVGRRLTGDVRVIDEAGVAALAHF